jgi:hypothetical protein
LKGFYVDDLLCSMPNAQKTIRMAEQLQKLLSKGGFRVTKFLSNSKEVLGSIPLSDRAATSVEIVAGKTPQRALGVTWEMTSDNLHVKLTCKPNRAPTRRSSISTICSIYDPLGICGPGLLPAKMILQAACKRNLQWDDELPEDLRNSWLKWRQELQLLEVLM